MAQQPKLLDQVRDVIRLQHYSICTERAYVDWIRRFILFHQKRHPQDIRAPEVQAFLPHLAVHQNVAASTQQQALSALLFLYREMLRQELPWMDDITRATKPKRLPVVLTQEEVRSRMAHLQGDAWLMASARVWPPASRVMIGVDPAISWAPTPHASIVGVIICHRNCPIARKGATHAHSRSPTPFRSR